MGIYGNHIKLRYDNAGSSFTFLELRRDSWNSGAAIGVAPISEIIASIPVNLGMNVIDVLDRAEASYADSEILDWLINDSFAKRKDQTRYAKLTLKNAKNQYKN